MGAQMEVNTCTDAPPGVRTLHCRVPAHCGVHADAPSARATSWMAHSVVERARSALTIKRAPALLEGVGTAGAAHGPRISARAYFTSSWLVMFTDHRSSTRTRHVTASEIFDIARLLSQALAGRARTRCLKSFRERAASLNAVPTLTPCSIHSTECPVRAARPDTHHNTTSSAHTKTFPQPSLNLVWRRRAAARRARRRAPRLFVESGPARSTPNLSQRLFPADSQAINATHDWATDTAALAPSDSLRCYPPPAQDAEEQEGRPGKWVRGVS